MKYARMGDTGLIVSRLSLGTMTFGTSSEGATGPLAAVDAKQATELVSRAIDAGINSFNSAACYSGGRSEEILGHALRGRRDNAVITTKVGIRSGRDILDGGLSARSIIKTAEDSLRRLGTDWIDVFAVHRVDEYTSVEEVVDALDLLVKQGKVRYTGFANWPAWMVGKAIGLQQGRGLARFRVAEMLYTLISRDIEHSHFPLLEESGIGCFVWSPLAGGLLSGKYTRENRDADVGRMSRAYALPFDWDMAYNVVDVTKEIAAAHGATPAQVAIGWLLAKRQVSSVLIGVSNMRQLEDNLAAADLTLAPEEIKKLDDLTTLPMRYPEWFAVRNADRIVKKALEA